MEVLHPVRRMRMLGTVLVTLVAAPLVGLVIFRHLHPSDGGAPERGSGDHRPDAGGAPMQQAKTDARKCAALKARLAEQPAPQLVPAAEFFDGNGDLGSIGCNLTKHPGITAFRDALASIARRPDVEPLERRTHACPAHLAAAAAR
jgi:hypothetical protein